MREIWNMLDISCLSSILFAKSSMFLSVSVPLAISQMQNILSCFADKDKEQHKSANHLRCKLQHLASPTGHTWSIGSICDSKGDYIRGCKY